ncbi:MAG: hypothetical protein ACRDRF_00670 [Pseudonocardiaceae bacterium]
MAGVQPARIPTAALIDALAGSRYPFWFPQEAKDLAIDYFAYGTDFEPLGASATTTRSIQINSDSAFMVLSAVMVETDTGNTVFFANRPLLVQLATGGAALNLFNQALHADNVFGTAEEPKYWDVPKVLLPNTTFNVTLQNLEAVARNVRVAFHGFKLFQFSK